MTDRVPVNFCKAVPGESGNYVQDSARVRRFLLVADLLLKAAVHDVDLV